MSRRAQSIDQTNTDFSDGVAAARAAAEADAAVLQQQSGRYMGQRWGVPSAGFTPGNVGDYSSPEGSIPDEGTS